MLESIKYVVGQPGTQPGNQKYWLETEGEKWKIITPGAMERRGNSGYPSRDTEGNVMAEQAPRSEDTEQSSLHSGLSQRLPAPQSGLSPTLSCVRGRRENWSYEGRKN